MMGRSAAGAGKEHAPAVRSRSQGLRWLTAGVVTVGWVGCRLSLYLLYLPLGAFLLWRALKKGDRHRRRTWFALGAGTILLWTAIYCLFWYAPAALLWNQQRQYTGTVTDYPREYSWGWSVEVRLKPEEGGSGVRAILYTTQSCAQVKPGDGIALETQLCSPGERNPSRFHSNAAKGIFARTRTVHSFKLTPAEKIPLRFWPKAAGKRVREKVSALFEGQEAGLMMALLTGNQEELTDPLADQLSRTGLRHVAAVSGLHVGFLMGLVLMLPGDRRVKQLMAGAVLILFCLIAGAGPSVVRATVMSLALLLGSFFRRDADSWASMRLALFLLLAHNPYALESVSLQLSFASVCGILLLGRRLNHFLTKGREPREKESMVGRIRRLVWASVSLSLSALVFTLPLTAYYFDTISLVAPLSNLLALWVVELIFCGGALVSAVGFFSMPLAKVLAVPVRGCFAYLRWVVEFFSRLPFCALSAHVGCYFLWLCVVYAVAVLLWRKRRLRRRAGLFAWALLVLLAFLISLNRTMLTGGGLAAQVVDVGQGQSVLFLSGDEAAAVDCGGYNAGNALANIMADAGESRLELLALTHFDNDHINGVEQLLERVRVMKIAIPDSEDDYGRRGEVERLAREHGVEVQLITENRRFSIGSMTLTLFAPVGTEGDNNTGLSALAEKGDFSVLVTGDMDMETELALAQREALHPVDVLVAGHHGSKTSSGTTFLKIVQPETAVISCGEFNYYGHPSPQALERLERAGCTIRRTDQDGTVTLAAPLKDE